MSVKRLISSLVILGLLGCLVLFAVSSKRSKAYANASNQALARIANQLEVEQRWEAVRQDIYCNIFTEGLTLEEIEGRITNVTSIVVSQNDIEGYEYFVHFTESYVKIDDLYLLFNEEDLLSEKWLSLGFGDIAEIDCP